MESVASQRPADAALPRIAVIVPNRNDSRYLPRCILSILEQEDPPDELIVVDDQSTDNSIRVVRSLIAGHDWARLIENPVNLGTYGALDKGLEVSRSEYVLFLSANDFVMPGTASGRGPVVCDGMARGRGGPTHTSSRFACPLAARRLRPPGALCEAG